MAPVARQIESLRAIGVQVDVLEVKGISKLKYLHAVAPQYVLARSADLIHAHYGYCGWLARMQLSKPVVVSFMGSDLLGTLDAEGRPKTFSRLVVQVDRWLARVVDAVIVKSVEMAQVVAPAKAHVVPNGVDLRAFRPMDRREARERLGWSASKRYVLFPGSPNIPRKGFHLAKDAVRIASKQLGEALELIPLTVIAHDQVPLHMNACEVMVMTSFHEGSPNAVKEAMACNLPVVSVPVGDVPELLEGLEGYTVCPRDAEALAEALVTILSAGSQRINGREALKQKGLDLESVARRLIEIYADVLAK
jgi:glycosyltransferase involved in cell wall biosynthesis